MSDIIYKTKLWQDVCDRITDEIREQRWLSGDRLPSESELAEKYAVSRSTVRQAVQSLKRAGIVEARAGSGTYVCPDAVATINIKSLSSVMADPKNISDLAAARYFLEPILASLAAKNATESDILALEGIVSEMESAVELLELKSCGSRFHKKVAESAHNSVLLGFYASSSASFDAVRGIEGLTLGIFIEGKRDHREILTAIKGRDCDGAHRLMREHIGRDYGGLLKI